MSQFVLWVFTVGSDNEPTVVKDHSTNPVIESSNYAEAEIFDDTVSIPESLENIAQSRLPTNKIVKSGNPSGPPPPPPGV